MPDADLREVSIAAIAPEVSLARRLRDRYEPGATPNGITYLFALGALFLPPLGVVAIVIAIRGIRQVRPRAAIALVVSVLATTIGVLAWVIFLGSTSNTMAPL